MGSGFVEKNMDTPFKRKNGMEASPTLEGELFMELKLLNAFCRSRPKQGRKKEEGTKVGKNLETSLANPPEHTSLGTYRVD